MLIKLFENYSTELEDIKEKILSEAIATDNADVVDFFVKKGYDITDIEYDYLERASRNINIFRYMLSKGVKEENLNDLTSFRYKEIQEALLDFGYWGFLKDKVGFNGINHEIKNNPKYKDDMDAIQGIEEFNL
jgi:hypothetical protein